MKKQISLLLFCALMMTALAFTFTDTQQEKNQKKKEQQNPKQQQNQKDKANKQDKTSPGKSGDKGQPGEKSNPQDNRDKNAKENEGKDKSEGIARGKYDFTDGFKWDRETFKDRGNIKNQEKVTLCHKVNSGDEPAVTIRVSSNALKAHMNHGDVVGECPAVTNSRFSDIFLRNRGDYYNNLQNHYEQVLYSQSILDYALARLTGARQQLVIMESNNYPPAEIENRRLLIVELDQNVSLLRTLLGVAANIAVNKLLY